MNSSRLRVVVVEADAPERLRLTRLLQAAGCTVVKGFGEDLPALEWLRDRDAAEAVFLGADPPNYEGMTVLRALGAQLPVVVCTARAEQALAAFDAEAADCLLKPFQGARLERALRRIEQRLRPAPAPPRPAEDRRYPVQEGHEVVLMDLERTHYFEVDRGVVWAHAGRRWRTRWKNLADVSATFPGAVLLRIHRHLLVRPEAVRGMRPSGGGRILVRLADGQELEASKGGAPKLREYFGIG